MTIRHKKILREAVVVQVGNGTPDIPMEVKPSDEILFHDDETKVTVDGNTLLNQSDVLLITKW